MAALHHKEIKQQETIVEDSKKILDKLCQSLLEGKFSTPNGETLLHIAARHQSEKAFIKLINMVSPEALSDALTLQDKDGLTPLYIATRRQSEKTVIELIKKADETAVSDALAIRNNHDWTVMTMAVDCGKTSVVLALFEKFQDEERLKEILFCHATSLKEKKEYFLHTVNQILNHITDHKPLDLENLIQSQSEHESEPISKLILDNRSQLLTKLRGVVNSSRTSHGTSRFDSQLDDIISEIEILQLNDYNDDAQLNASVKYGIELRTVKPHLFQGTPFESQNETTALTGRLTAR